jgi:hypothetical protein
MYDEDWYRKYREEECNEDDDGQWLADDKCWYREYGEEEHNTEENEECLS